VIVRDAVTNGTVLLQAARVVRSGDAFGVEVTFTRAGTAKMRAVTSANVGRRLAVIVDGRLIASPVVRSAIAELGVLSGDYAQVEAQRIAAAIVPRRR
jgi:preprotein translocase subunit SecD